MNGSDVLTIIISVLMLVLLAGGIRLHSNLRHGITLGKKTKSPSTEAGMLSTISQMQRTVTELPEKDRTWFYAQARAAGFDLYEPQPRLKTVPAHREALNLSGGTPDHLIITINGITYQKWTTTKGSYLKELPRAQEEVHEESTTVRDFAGSVVAEHRLCECPECSSSNVPDVVRHNLPARLDTGQ